MSSVAPAITAEACGILSCGATRHPSCGCAARIRTTRHPSNSSSPTLTRDLAPIPHSRGRRRGVYSFVEACRATRAPELLAGGLLRLSEITGNPAYRKPAGTIVQSLIDRYLSQDGVLRHGCSTRSNDVRLVCGDYYLLETLLALEHNNK